MKTSHRTASALARIARWSLTAGASFCLAACNPNWEEEANLETNLKIVVPQVFADGKNLSDELSVLASSFLDPSSKNEDIQRFIAPRSVEWSHVSSPLEAIEMANSLNLGEQVWGSGAPVDPDEQTAKIKGLFESIMKDDSAEYTKIKELLNREASHPEPALAKWVSKMVEEGQLVVAVGLASNGAAPKDPEMEGVPFYSNVQDFQKSLPQLLVDQIKADGFEPGMRRPVPPPIDVSVIVVTDDGPDLPVILPPRPPFSPAIKIGEVSPASADHGKGDSEMVEIRGTVHGIEKIQNHRVVMYSLRRQYLVQPDAVAPLIKVEADGTWHSKIQKGSEYCALLVTGDFQPKAVVSAALGLPPVDRNKILAKATVAGEQEQTSSIYLKLESDKREYAADWDVLRVKMEVSEKCYVRLYCKQSDGKVIQLLPNRFAPQRCVLQPGVIHQFPGEDAEYEYRIKAPLGRETLMAVGSPVPFSDAELVGSADFPDFGSGRKLEDVASRGVVVQAAGAQPFSTDEAKTPTRTEAPPEAPVHSTATASAIYFVTSKKN